MPVEIKELIIRPVAEEAVSPAEEPQGSPPEADREAIIQACVKEVMRILKKTRKR